MVIKAFFFFLSSSLLCFKKIFIQRFLSFTSRHSWFHWLLACFVSARTKEEQREPARILGYPRIGLSDRGLSLVALVELRRDYGIVLHKFVSFFSFRSRVSSPGDVYTLRSFIFSMFVIFICVFVLTARR